jgi:TolB-like protein
MLIIKVIFLCFMVIGASSAAVQTIAISYFDNTSKDKDFAPLSKGFADMLITDLSNIKSIKIVEREKLESILKEIKLGESKFIDQKTAQKIGKGLGSSQILTGSYLIMGENMRIDTRLVKVETGEIIMAEKVEGKKNDFAEMEKSLVDLLVNKLNLTLNMQEKKELRKYQTESFEAFKEYSNGIDALDNKIEEAAKDFFKKALSADPNYLSARTATERLQAIIKYDESKKRNEIDNNIAQIFNDANSNPKDISLKINILFSKIDIIKLNHPSSQEDIARIIKLLNLIFDKKVSSPHELNVLYLLSCSYSFDPSILEMVPSIYEYLYMKYPQMAGSYFTTGYLDGINQKINEIKKKRNLVKNQAALIKAGKIFPVDFDNDLRQTQKNIASEALKESWQQLDEETKKTFGSYENFLQIAKKNMAPEDQTPDLCEKYQSELSEVKKCMEFYMEATGSITEVEKYIAAFSARISKNLDNSKCLPTVKTIYKKMLAEEMVSFAITSGSIKLFDTYAPLSTIAKEKSLHTQLQEQANFKAELENVRKLFVIIAQRKK